jgi:hypothetical protein
MVERREKVNFEFKERNPKLGMSILVQVINWFNLE